MHNHIALCDQIRVRNKTEQALPVHPTVGAGCSASATLYQFDVTAHFALQKQWKTFQ